MTFRLRTLAVAIAAIAATTVPVSLWFEVANAQTLISQSDNASSGDDFVEAFGLIQQGIQFIGDGEPESALNVLNESLSISRTIGDRQLESISLIARGKALLDTGEVDSARTSVEEGLAIAQDLDDAQLEELAQGVLAEFE